MMWAWGHHGWGAGMWTIMVLFMLIFWAVVVFGVMALVRRNSQTRDAPTAQTSNAEEILRERFARGEIPEDEYREKLKHLRADV